MREIRIISRLPTGERGFYMVLMIKDYLTHYSLVYGPLIEIDIPNGVYHFVQALLT